MKSLEPKSFKEPLKNTLCVAAVLCFVAFAATSARAITGMISDASETTAAAAPEPATLALLGTGPAGLVARSRCKRRPEEAA